MDGVETGERPPWQDLADHFTLMTSGAPEIRADWPEIWHVIVKDAWFTRSLADIASRILHRYSLPADWHEDVEHDAILILHQELSKQWDLHFDAQRLDHGFGAWMGTIIDHACCAAVRTARRRRKKTRALGDFDTPRVDRRIADATRRELGLCIDCMDEPTRSILLRCIAGQELAEIAESLGLSLSSVKRRRADGIDRLRRELATDD